MKAAWRIENAGLTGAMPVSGFRFPVGRRSAGLNWRALPLPCAIPRNRESPMPQPIPSPAGVQFQSALRNTHRSVLAVLAVCAVVIATRESAVEPTPDRFYTVLAIGAALATIVLRRLSTSPVAGFRARVGFALAGLVCAASLGLVGVVVAVELDAKQTGLVYTLAAAIFSLRAPDISPSS
jgi:hypothetical protein